MKFPVSHASWDEPAGMLTVSRAFAVPLPVRANVETGAGLTTVHNARVERRRPEVIGDDAAAGDRERGRVACGRPCGVGDDAPEYRTAVGLRKDRRGVRWPRSLR